ncbi:hypothetical protein [Amycolatopsis sp.]|uniref:hypothetical protein n=1 Tax=Amycolatopsis sp. TaxID=37632 RepID=UPI002D7F08BD|nr:hypothetical protein [Amycolatopsis sp.]HET6705972.1 hypothetical protein [Amycolatopsis sp.]
MFEELGTATVDITFVFEPGSHFGDKVVADLTAKGARVISWEQALKTEFDVILAAHASVRLAELGAPVVALPHGAGNYRLVEYTTGDCTSPTGLARSQLLGPDGTPTVARILLSNPALLDWLRETCPEVAGRAVVLGDPVLDRMRANHHRREEFRRALGLSCGQRLVVASSTWGKHSLWARHPRLAHCLLGSLPMDEYRVAQVLHPNIWEAESAYGIRLCLRDELDSGLLLIPDQSSWEAVVLAADVVIGDHGSVAVYGAALDIPFLLGADGRAELTPWSPTAQLCASAVRLDPAAPLKPQLDQAITHYDPAVLRPTLNRMFANDGEARNTVCDTLYEVMGRRRPGTKPRQRPLDRPQPIREESGTAFAVVADLIECRQACGTVAVRRYPGPVTDLSGRAGLIPVITASEVDPERRSDAEIVVNEEVLTDPRAWFDEVRRTSPGAKLVAARIPDGCLLLFDDDTVLCTPDEDVLATTIAAYVWKRAMRPWPETLLLRTDVGGHLSRRTVAPHRR